MSGRCSEGIDICSNSCGKSQFSLSLPPHRKLLWSATNKDKG